MFFEVDTTNLPLFEISLYDIEKPSEFQDFLDFWGNIHSKNKKYFFLFNTENMSIPMPNYCIKLANFIKELKKKEANPLEFSIICVKNSILRNMTAYLFKLTTPLSPVYIVKDKEEGKAVYNDLTHGKEVTCKKIIPKKYKNLNVACA